MSVSGWRGTGFGAAPDSTSKIKVIAVDAHASTVSVPGDWLTGAHFARAGSDLLLVGRGGERLLIRDYFASDAPPALAGDGGAVLPGDLVDLLAGGPAPGQYAEAEPGVAALAIGRVSEVAGEVSATRADGTLVALGIDAAVFQGDIIQSGPGAAIAITFVDETVFSLGEDGRMVLDEMIFDPDTLDGSSTVSVLEGVFAFVSGEIAANNPDEMLVRSPVATLGIRGTRVGGEGAAEGETNTFVLLPNPGQPTSAGTIAVQTPGAALDGIAPVVLDEPYHAGAVASAFDTVERFVMTPEDAAEMLGQVSRALSDTGFMDDLRLEQSPEPVIGDAGDLTTTLATITPIGPGNAPAQDRVAGSSSAPQNASAGDAPRLAAIAPGGVSEIGLGPALYDPKFPVAATLATVTGRALEAAEAARITTLPPPAFGPPASNDPFVLLRNDDLVAGGFTPSLAGPGAVFIRFEGLDWSVIGGAAPIDDGFGLGALGNEAMLLTGASGSALALEQFFGLAPGSLAQASGGAQALFNGAAMKTTLDVLAGDTISFRFNFLHTESQGAGGANNDFAFFVDDVFKIADVEGADGGAVATAFGDARQSGFLEVFVEFQISGPIDIGFGVINAGDDLDDPALVITNIGINAPFARATDAAVEEAALDLVRDGADIAAASVIGSNPESTAETVRGILDFSSVDPAVVTGAVAGLQPGDDVAGNVGAEVPGAFGVLVVEADGGFTYSLTGPAAHGAEPVVDVFRYAITDSDGEEDIGMLTVTIGDDAPIARADQAAAVEGGEAALGNVVTGAGTLFPAAGADAPSADGTILRSVLHDGRAYTLSADGGSVGASDGSADHGFDGTTLGIPTALGGDLSIDLVGPSAGAYLYAPPPLGAIDADAEERFDYTLEDGDGDRSTTALTVALGDVAEPVAIVIDFETDGLGAPLVAGDVVGDAYAALGLTITSFDAENHPPMIFDSSDPTVKSSGDDDDLGTPNQDFGGPGVGAGGGAGQPGENGIPLGNVLIISEDGDPTAPDDFGLGGTISFGFAEPVGIASLDILDSENGGTVRAFAGDDGLIADVPIARLGNNSVQEVRIDADGVARLEVTLFGSGAIDNLAMTALLSQSAAVERPDADGYSVSADPATPPDPGASGIDASVV